ncbi:MAG: hypothetical protein KAT68_03710 [Bacteroidales bacterium]|nr:hypothetical protein [Bacteroidales bacterium]
MKIIFKIFLLFFFINLHPICANSQYQKYSIDRGKLNKSGRVGLKYRIAKFKENRKEHKKAVDAAKLEKSTERERKKYRKKMQTKKVLKRMKKSEKKAKRNTKNKPVDPFYIRIIKKIKK